MLVKVTDGVEIRAANGRDLWRLNVSAPRLLHPAHGDFAIEIVCRSVPGNRPAIGGLTIWRDRKNFLTLVKGALGKNELSFRGCIETKDVILGRGRLRGERIHLRLERLGDVIKAFCRDEGGEWFTVGQAEFSAPGLVEVGLFAGGWIDRTIYQGAFPEGAAMRFDSFRMWQDWPTD